jgi:hypothetical protein
MDKDKSVEAPEAEEPQTNWQFNSGEAASSHDGSTSLLPSNPVTWTAAEFIDHEKGQQWYITLGIGTVVAIGVIYLLTHDLITSAVIAIVAVMFGLFAARKPRKLEYTIDSEGVHIGGRFYPYGNFKSFSLVQEGPAHSVWLLPLKRFTPIIPLCFDLKDETAVVDALSRTLPLENRDLDSIDKLMHRVRF